MNALNEPTWVDLQVNGYGGISFNADAITVDDVKTVVAKLADAGTARFCPTLCTGDPEKVCGNLAVIDTACKNDAECERRIAGIHIEGPFISREPGAVGAHNPRWVHKPDIDLFNRYRSASGNRVRIVTIAAEAEGAADFARAVSNDGITVSLGHQMADKPSQFTALADAGAKALTHLGNGIPNLIDRHNNAIWCGLAEDRLTVMCIPDGHHLPRHVLKVFIRAAGIDRIVAVTDSSYVAGLPPGRYKDLDNNAVLEPDGLFHNPEKHCLVGSSANMAQVVAVLMSQEVGLTYEQCIRVCRDNPLRLIGLK